MWTFSGAGAGAGAGGWGWAWDIFVQIRIPHLRGFHSICWKAYILFGQCKYKLKKVLVAFIRYAFSSRRIPHVSQMHGACRFKMLKIGCFSRFCYIFVIGRPTCLYVAFLHPEGVITSLIQSLVPVEASLLKVDLDALPQNLRSSPRLGKTPGIYGPSPTLVCRWWALSPKALGIYGSSPTLVCGWRSLSLRKTLGIYGSSPTRSSRVVITVPCINWDLWTYVHPQGGDHCPVQ